MKKTKKKLNRLYWKLTCTYSERARGDLRPLQPPPLSGADAIVTCNEVTDHHGTGVILNRIFRGSPNILSLRSTHLYPDHSLGAASLLFRHEGLSRKESFERVLFLLNGSTVRRVLCVPYHPDELMTALVLKEVFGAPLCTYLMDDNNIYSHGIPDDLMREVLQKSELRLAISPELRDAYEQKYGLKFWIVPPVVQDEVVEPLATTAEPEVLRNRAGVLVGSLWSSAWLKKLRQVVHASGLQVHWYGNAKATWLNTNSEELRHDGIVDCGFIPEAELTQRLKNYAYALVPSGTLDQEDDRPEIARLSLPTRMVYLLAGSHTPMVVLGSERTAAAGFVQRFGVGCVCPYEPAALSEAVAGICEPPRNAELRARAASQSAAFSARGLASWVWESLARGEPLDDRFEAPFRRKRSDIVQYLDAPVPKELLGDFALVYQALRRLKAQGCTPDFVLDVGSSSGVWSDVAARVFPKARFVLVDPLQEQYVRLNSWYFKQHPEFECVGVAVSDRPGTAELSVSPDLYGSSLLRPNDLRAYESLRVPVRTLDEVAREKQLTGRGLVKIDVQFAEHLVLAGATEILPQVDVLILELSLVRYASQSMLFIDMCELLRDLGFRYYEDVGGWRSPVDGTLLQKDVVFVRNTLGLGPDSEGKAQTGEENGQPRDKRRTRATEPAVAANALPL